MHVYRVTGSPWSVTEVPEGSVSQEMSGPRSLGRTAYYHLSVLCQSEIVIPWPPHLCGVVGSINLGLHSEALRWLVLFRGWPLCTDFHVSNLKTNKKEFGTPNRKHPRLRISWFSSVTAD